MDCVSPLSCERAGLPARRDDADPLYPLTSIRPNQQLFFLNFDTSIASSLTHLSIEIYLTRLDAIAPPVAQLLPLLTKLTVFYVYVYKPKSILDMLHLVPSQLKFLNINMSPDTAEEAQRWSQCFRKVLELPCLSAVKHIRVGFLGIHLKEGAKGWLTECEERGIEVRDQRRFFTGE